MGQGPALSSTGSTGSAGAEPRPGELSRRSLLGASLASLAPLGCSGDPQAGFDGGWVGAGHERGHLLRGGAAGIAGIAGIAGSPAAPRPPLAATRRVGAVIVGAGVAGLAAARALRRAGVDDCHVLELEDSAGGNSRGHAMGGMRCPLGAHYLPVPGERDVEVAELLEEMGVRTTVQGRPAYDERMLCHAPQERLFIAGGWRDGLLPPVEALPAADRASTLADYGDFAVAAASFGDGAFTIPTAHSRWSDALAALDRTTFAAWLDARGLHAPALRWYLDYCCRDDYGAGAAQVSAWAGLHYFASRHGFRAPGDAPRGGDAVDGVLTWPEGNAWLAQRLAAPLADRLHAGRVAVAVEEGRHEVSVDCWDAAGQRLERWVAPRVVLAVPLFVAARLLVAPPAALAEAAGRARHAPWLVANLLLDGALDDRPGAPPSWDNVVYGSAGLGYVDAMHQSLGAVAGRIEREASLRIERALSDLARRDAERELGRALPLCRGRAEQHRHHRQNPL